MFGIMNKNKFEIGETIWINARESIMVDEEPDYYGGEICVLEPYIGPASIINANNSYYEVKLPIMINICRQTPRSKRYEETDLLTCMVKVLNKIAKRIE